MSIERKVPLITGVTDGIGEATAHKVAVVRVKAGVTARYANRLDPMKVAISAKGSDSLADEMDEVDLKTSHADVAKLITAYGTEAISC